jgi:hypothetical protein
MPTNEPTKSRPSNPAWSADFPVGLNLGPGVVFYHAVYDLLAQLGNAGLRLDTVTVAQVDDILIRKVRELSVADVDLPNSLLSIRETISASFVRDPVQQSKVPSLCNGPRFAYPRHRILPSAQFSGVQPGNGPCSL